MPTTVAGSVREDSLVVLNTAKGLEVRIRPDKTTAAVLFHTCWVIVWVVTEVVMLGTLLRLHEQPQQLLWLMLIAFWTYGGVLALRMFLWLLSGEEHIVVEDTRLSFRRAIAGLGPWRRFRADEIRSLVVAPGQHPWHWRGIVDRITLTSRGSKLAFGRGLDERDARRVVDLVKEELREGSSRRSGHQY